MLAILGYSGVDYLFGAFCVFDYLFIGIFIIRYFWIGKSKLRLVFLRFRNPIESFGLQKIAIHLPKLLSYLGLCFLSI